MRVLVTGATGLIGRRLTGHLVASGCAVRALTRDPDAARRLLPALEDAHPWPGAPPETFEGVEAVVHLAGASVSGRWTAAHRAAIRESRVAGTRSLVDALARLAVRPRLLISASAIGYYGDRGDEDLTEASPAGEGFLAGVCREWESEALRARQLGLRVALLRTGLVLDARGGALRAMLPLYRAGLGGALGAGRQWWSWIDARDLVGFIGHLLEPGTGAHGPFNAVAPEPARQREFARSLGRTLRRPAFWPAPSFALRVLLGGFAEELLASRRVLPQRAKEIGFVWRHGELDGALREILGAGRPA